MHSRTRALFIIVLSLLALPLSLPAVAADQALKPYLLGSRGAGTVAVLLPEVKAALEQKGFTIAGEYAPYAGAHVIAVTSDALKTAAGRTTFGAYGAVMRVSLTETGKEVQVAAMNPRYFAAAYRMKDGLDEVAEALKEAIGAATEFGSREGMTAAKLRKYHYMIMMPYFDDPVELAGHPSQEEALKTIEANLDARAGGSSRVYRVDVPGGKETVIGVAITEGEGADKAIMKVIDAAELKHTPHLPYEMVVSGGKVYMLHGKFRIALDFPDLTMGTFMKISGAPSAIEERLKLIAGGK